MVDTAPLVVNTAPLVVNTALPRPVLKHIDQQGRVTTETINPNATEATSSFYAKQQREAAFQAREEVRDPQRPPLGKPMRDWSREELEYEKKFLREHHSVAPYVASRYWPSMSRNLADPTYFAELCARRNAREY